LDLLSQEFEVVIQCIDNVGNGGIGVPFILEISVILHGFAFSGIASVHPPQEFPYRIAIISGNSSRYLFLSYEVRLEVLQCGMLCISPVFI